MNALVYAAARTVHQLWADDRSQKRRNTCNWFRRKAGEEAKYEKLIRLTAHEVERRRQKRASTARDLIIIKELGESCGTLSTSMLLKRLEQGKQELTLLKNRISLREQEMRRKMLRKRFAERPSLQVLIRNDKYDEKISKQHSRGDRPDTSTVLKFWKSVIGKPKNFDADQLEELRMWREKQKAEYPSDAKISKAELIKI